MPTAEDIPKSGPVLARGLGVADRAQLLNDLNNPNVQRCLEAVASLPHYLGSPVSADKGVEAFEALDPSRFSESGTVDFVRMHAPFGTMIILR